MNEEESVKVFFYDNTGQPNSVEEKAYAKKKIILRGKNKIEKFYVQKYTTGVNSGHMRNDNGLYSVPKLGNHSNPQRGNKFFELREVKEEAFNHYLKFLQTGDILYYRYAERIYQ